MLTHMPDHSKPKIIIGPYLGYRCMVDLERFNLLAQIGGVSPDVDRIANTQRRASLKLQGSD